MGSVQCPIYPLFPKLDVKLFTYCAQVCCRGYPTTALSACCLQNSTSSTYQSFSNDFVFHTGRDDYYSDIKTTLSVIFAILGCFILAPFLIISVLFLIKKCVNKKISDRVQDNQEASSVLSAVDSLYQPIWSTQSTAACPNEAPPSYSLIDDKKRPQSSSSKLPTYTSVMNLRTAAPIEVVVV